MRTDRTFADDAIRSTSQWIAPTAVTGDAHARNCETASDTSRWATRGLQAALGLLLLAAALLKVYQAGTQPTLGERWISQRWLTIGVVQAEFALAVWLITGIAPRAASRVALAAFGCFACVSLFHALRGADSCGCFGAVKVNPWVTLALDVGVCLALLVVRPRGLAWPAKTERTGWVVAAVAAFSILAVPSSWLMARGNATSLGEDGILVGSGSLIVLEPEKWIGKAFPLGNFIDIGEALKTGRWKVVLYHHGCPKCEALIAEHYQAEAAHGVEPDRRPVALVEMPPYGPRDPSVPAVPSRIVRGKLTDRQEWFAAAPVELELVDGKVVGATSGGG